MSKIVKYSIILLTEIAVFVTMCLCMKQYDLEHETRMAGFTAQSTEEVEEAGWIIQAQAGKAGPPAFTPHAVESTAPEQYLLSWETMVDGEALSIPSEYESRNPFGDIRFDLGSEYTRKEGVFTFRGNNFRDNPVYGRTNYEIGSLVEKWSAQSGALSYKDAVWSGSGWTGQPLIRKWDERTKQHMNMHDWAKNKEDLVEVIYACMDGFIYFLDLETGQETRDRLWLGFTFKGAGALDPRGYPVMYVGAGYDSAKGHARVFILNLLDCSVMREFGNDDPFGLRGTLSYFDSSALVDAETDTLIYPGENGVLYLLHLGTTYHAETGELSMTFDRSVKWRYRGKRTTIEKYWPGMETSAAIYQNYLFIADNGANLICLDLNTLKPVWVQDILDDSNSTPVLSMENGHLYLYVSTSFHLGWRSTTTAVIPVWKIDAETGEVVWKTEFECSTLKGVSGGVQSTIALGQRELKDQIYVTVAMSHGTYGGDIIAMKKEDGSTLWGKQISYTWSSPVCVYDKDGKGEVLYATSEGVLYAVDGLTGNEKSRIRISTGNVEASPAVYENMLVVGTRAGRIYGIGLQ